MFIHSHIDTPFLVSKEECRKSLSTYVHYPDDKQGGHCTYRRNRHIASKLRQVRPAKVQRETKCNDKQEVEKKELSVRNPSDSVTHKMPLRLSNTDNSGN